MLLAGGVQCSTNNGVKQPAEYPVQRKNSNWDYDHIEQDVAVSVASTIVFTYNILSKKYSAIRKAYISNANNIHYGLFHCELV
ncbi:hypothetical protein [Shewanella polaris]|uniref:Uncharacterized protein n=1 Tax=Shewanella polaris TaxID=2588449 RepID=A0A4Y5YJV9_9GAMM|nr:hypothetical protein [Shewanella polaris]QDE32779.1 hypothetical protein FH971_18515 [Shewanella polaris]